MNNKEALEIMDILECVQLKIERANRLLAEYGIEIFHPGLHLSDGRNGKLDSLAEALGATVKYTAVEGYCLIEFKYEGHTYTGGTSV